MTIENDGQLLKLLTALAEMKRQYDKISSALEEVRATGYGIVMPTAEEMHMEVPEIVRKGSAYGVKLRASAPSIHMMRADIKTEISPMVGDEQQSEDLVKYLLGEYEGKKFKSINDEDAIAETEEEKKAAEEKAEQNKAVLDFLKETLGERIHDVRISRILKSHAVCLTADGPVSLEMEKYFQRTGNELMTGMKAQRVLELNSDSPAFTALKNAVENDKELAKKYAELLYSQALLIAELPLEDPSAYADLVCSLMK